MTLSAIKHICYSVTGAYTAGAIAGLALQAGISQKTAAAAYPYFRSTGLALAITATVAKVADELFKALGWQTNEGARLLAAHIVAGIIVVKPIMIIVGYPAVAGKLVAVAVTVSSYAVNLIVK